jgi:hypothetical protein
MYIAELAVQELPEGELRAILSDPELLAVVQSGAFYPDTGYAVDDAYGEWSHWEPFLEAYLDVLRARHGAELGTAEARRAVAFLMGVAAHQICDQVYDALFMRRTEEIDGTDADLDLANDIWVVYDRGRRVRVDSWAPLPDLVGIYGGVMGHAVAEDTIARGLDRMELAMWAVIELSDGPQYEEHWLRLPWAASHYLLDPEPGSHPFLAQVVAAYWQVLFARLRGTDDPASSLIRTVPRDGAVNVAVDHTSVDGWTTLVFAHSIDDATIADGAVTLRDGAGAIVDAEVRPFRSGFVNVIRVRPRIDLAFDTEHVVTAGDSLRLIDGRTLPPPAPFSFRTRCAPDRLADCPPLDEPWVRPESAPMRDAGRPIRRDAGADGGAVGGEDAGSAMAPATGGGGCDCHAAAGRKRAEPLATGLLLLLLATGSRIRAAPRARRMEPA